MAACPSPLLTVLYHLQIAQGAPCLIVQVMKTEVKRYWSQYQPLGTLLVTHLQLTDGQFTALPTYQISQLSVCFAHCSASLYLIILHVKMLWESVKSLTEGLYKRACGRYLL